MGSIFYTKGKAKDQYHPHDDFGVALSARQKRLRLKTLGKKLKNEGIKDTEELRQLAIEKARGQI